MGYDMHTVHEDTYFRLNISGMGVTSRLMDRLGMIHMHDVDRVDALLASGNADDIDRALTYTPEHPGICGWKLGSNDPWHIHPVELRSALDIYATRPRPDDAPVWWDDWIAYLHRAVDEGGIIQG